MYKSSEFIKEFHVLRDMTMADYERRGGEEITWDGIDLMRYFSSWNKLAFASYKCSLSVIM
jgi:hypothetical protein